MLRIVFMSMFLFVSSSAAAITLDDCEIRSITRLNVSRGVLLRVDNCSLGSYRYLWKIRIVNETADSISQLTQLATQAMIHKLPTSITIAQDALECESDPNLNRRCTASSYEAFAIRRLDNKNVK